MYLYLLEQENTGKFYIGITDNIKRRLIEHNTKHDHYTGRQGNHWIIVGYKCLPDSIARSEEIRLKKAKNKKYTRWYFMGA